MILIVGLGNPGEQYQHTRHNLGFGVIDELLIYYRVERVIELSSCQKFNAEIFKLANSSNSSIILIKPTTFMNASGFAVAKAANFYKIPSENIWVVHDEVDLAPGKIKIRLGGSAAGHRGVISIIDKLGTARFVRFRLGIGHPKELGDEHLSVEKYVLQADARANKKMIKKATEAIVFALDRGLTKAMTRFNS